MTNPRMATLEPLAADEAGTVVDIAMPVELVVAAALAGITAGAPAARAAHAAGTFDVDLAAGLTDASQMVGLTQAKKRSELVPATIAAGCDMFLFFRNPAEDFGYMLEGYNPASSRKRGCGTPWPRFRTGAYADPRRVRPKLSLKPLPPHPAQA
jgi:hypothetical protein